MLSKIYDFLKSNRREIGTFLLILIVFLFPFPYYIDSPGGTISLKDKIEIENAKEINGDISLIYVTERRANIPSILLSFVLKDWDIIKKEEVVLNNETDKDAYNRGKVALNQSYSSAIILAFEKAGIPYQIKNEKVFVYYVMEQAKTNLKVGDQILALEGVQIYKKADIANVLANHEIGDKLKITVLVDGREEERYAEIIDYEGKKIGFAYNLIYDYELSQAVTYKNKASETGSSGGFMNALYIYAALIEEDIIKGRKIVGTGTIADDGTVGAIGGVKYKLKTAFNSKADIFFVSSDNCYEALKLKQENKYELNVVCVSNFDEAVAYLKEN